MARQTGPFFLDRTIGNICFYKVKGRYLVRQKSTLTGKRVKTNAAYKLTMIYAGMMSTSSKIASVVYKALPAHWKQFWMYRAFVGEAMEMLKEGRGAEETARILWERYAAEFAEGYEEITAFQHPAPVKKITSVSKSTLAPARRILRVDADGRLYETVSFRDEPAALGRASPVYLSSIFS